MKRIICNIFLLLMTFTAYATGQDSDVIYINGELWELLGKPVYQSAVLSDNLIAALPKDRTTSTANDDGFTAFWSIRRDVLRLDSIKYKVFDKTTKKFHEKKLPSKTLLTVFKEYASGKQIVASWIMGNIRMAKGKVIYYQHDGYERDYEEEQLISLKHGKVTKKNVFHNYVIDGLAFDDYSSMKDEDFAKKFPLHVERYPELADAKRILFTVKRARVDATGHLVDCEMRAIVSLNDKTTEHKGIANEMAKCMKAYYPWRVLYINGEYRAGGIEGWNFPYRLNGK